MNKTLSFGGGVEVVSVKPLLEKAKHPRTNAQVQIIPFIPHVVIFRITFGRINWLRMLFAQDVVRSLLSGKDPSLIKNHG
ncbi:MAG TPA: hypothetical protein VFC07_08540 [Verrucomicrobiae bacterium]|nr:hypothetical protein [Verrucomicrobiae bacterium]